MSTPTLGFGWNEVAFSGSSRPASADPRDEVEVGAGHQHRHARDCGARPAPRRPSGGRRSAARAASSAGSRSSCSTSTAARLPPSGSRSVAQCGAVGGDDGVLGCQGAEGLPAARRERRPRAAQAAPQVVEGAAEQDPVDGAEEERGVVLVDEHRQPAVRRAAGGAARCMPQVGGVAVVAVGDQGAGAGQRRVERGEVLGASRIAQIRWCCSARSANSWSGGCRRARASHDRAHRRRDRGGPAGSGPGSAPSRPSGRRARRPAPGGCPRAATRRGRRGRGPVRDVERRRRGRGR